MYADLQVERFDMKTLGLQGKKSPLAVLVMGMFIIASTFVSVAQPTAAHAAVGGTVICANGQAIQGIWIEAADPAKRGWATRWTTGAGSDENGWSYSALNSGDSYQIRVGCGSWTPEYRSTMWNAHSGSFLCLMERGAAVCRNI